MTLCGLAIVMLAAGVVDMPHQGKAMTKLAHLLDRRLAHKKEAQEVEKIDAEIRQQFEKPVAVMVTDMSGFTDRTQKNGIASFLGEIRRLQVLAHPVIKAHGARLVKVDADDLFVVHEKPRELLALARDLLAAVKKMNIAEGETMGLAIGLGYGPTLVIGDEDVFGNPVNVASKLGEDVARGGEILLSEDFYEAVGDAQALAGCEKVEPRARQTKWPYYLCR